MFGGWENRVAWQLLLILFTPKEASCIICRWHASPVPLHEVFFFLPPQGGGPPELHWVSSQKKTLFGAVHDLYIAFLSFSGHPLLLQLPIVAHRFQHFGLSSGLCNTTGVPCSLSRGLPQRKALFGAVHHLHITFLSFSGHPLLLPFPIVAHRFQHFGLNSGLCNTTGDLSALSNEPSHPSAILVILGSFWRDEFHERTGWVGEWVGGCPKPLPTEY